MTTGKIHLAVDQADDDKVHSGSAIVNGKIVGWSYCGRPTKAGKPEEHRWTGTLSLVTCDICREWGR